ncbi:MAG: hypothetical protein MR874_03475 [Coriobacteriaceae bacterium]|nr:hypothetical protein [Coriobacteriaceae bacterium]
MADTAYDDRATVRIGGREYEVEASNLACRIYADEFREADSKSLTGDDVEDAGRYSGRLIHDLLLDRQRVLAAGVDWPEWDEVPRILAAIWAMARAAGSTKTAWKAFAASVEHAPANLYEVSVTANHIFDLGNLTFFRLPDGLGDAQEPDEGET